MNRKLVRLFSFFGIASPAIAVLGTLATLWSAPGFSLTSSLYSLSASESSSIMLNSALGMTSAVLMMFSACLFEVTKGSPLGNSGATAHLAASLSLLVCGMLKEMLEPYSGLFWLVFLVAFPASAALTGVYHFQTGKREWGALGCAAAVLAWVLWLARWPSLGVSELASAGVVLLWQLAYAWSLFQEASREPVTPTS